MQKRSQHTAPQRGAAQLSANRWVGVMDYLLFLIGTVLVNNVVLVHFLGLCPFMGVSGKLDPSLGMGFLRILAYILVIAALVQFIELLIRKSSPKLYRALGIYLPLITTNCAVLGPAAPRAPGGRARAPAPCPAPPIAFVTAGLLAMTFMGFGGLI